MNSSGRLLDLLHHADPKPIARRLIDDAIMTSRQGTLVPFDFTPEHRTVGAAYAMKYL